MDGETGNRTQNLVVAGGFQNRGGGLVPPGFEASCLTY
jgi:hypothetical protein